MAFDFNKLKEDIVSAGKEVGDKVGEAADVARIKIDIRTKEDFIQKQYAELGKAYFASVEKETPLQAEVCMDTIREAKEELQRLNDQLLEVQGNVLCNNCGMKQPTGSNYCQNCGAPLVQSNS